MTLLPVFDGSLQHLAERLLQGIGISIATRVREHREMLGVVDIEGRMILKEGDGVFNAQAVDIFAERGAMEIMYGIDDIVLRHLEDFAQHKHGEVGIEIAFLALDKLNDLLTQLSKVAPTILVGATDTLAQTFGAVVQVVEIPTEKEEVDSLQQELDSAQIYGGGYGPRNIMEELLGINEYLGKYMALDAYEHQDGYYNEKCQYTHFFSLLQCT